MSFVLESGAEAGQLAAFRLGGDSDLRDVVIAKPFFDLSSSEASQFTFEVSDPDFRVLGSGKLTLGSALEYMDLRFAVTGIEVPEGVETPSLSITCLAVGVVALRDRKGPLVLSNTSPTDFARREAESVGLAFVGQDSAAVPQITRADPSDGESKEAESSWDVIRRLASEIGFVAFEAAGTLFFAKPSWLVSRAGGRTWVVRYPDPGQAGEVGVLGVPGCRRSQASDPPVTITVSLMQYHAAPMRPGDKVVFAGVPTFEGDYLVTSVPLTVDGVSPCTVEIATPSDPEPRPQQADDPFVDDSKLEPLYTDNSVFDVGGGDVDGVGGTDAWVWPAQGSISSKFGVNRGDHMHGGIDIANGIGSRIVAARAGTVKRAQISGVSGFGSLIVIDHGAGVESWYGHMNKHVVSAVAQGGVRAALNRGPRFRAPTAELPNRVAAGQLIGYMGSEGRSTGSHLHFEVHRHGRRIDPQSVLPPPQWGGASRRVT